jgi:hypothetical protein
MRGRVAKSTEAGNENCLKIVLLQLTRNCEIRPFEPGTSLQSATDELLNANSGPRRYEQPIATTRPFVSVRRHSG